MATMVDYFRFLDLPRELRDRVYDYTLCSFSQRTTDFTIGFYARVHAQASFQHREFLGTVNILLACRQIHHEGYSYMLKSNLFIRVECRGIDISKFMHSHTPQLHILAFSRHQSNTRMKRTQKYPWYAMCLWIGVETKQSQYMYRKEYANIVLLRIDLEEFCRRLEIEQAARTQSDPKRHIVKIVVELDPCKYAQGDEENKDRSVQCMRKLFSPKMQEDLLRPVRTGIRGFKNLTIKGCTEKQLVQRTLQEVESPLWTNAEAFMSELRKHRNNSVTCQLKGDYVQSAGSCAAGISMLNRLCVSPSSLEYFRKADSTFDLFLAEAYFSFHLTMGRCIYNHFKPSIQSRIDTNKQSEILSACFDIVSILSHIFDISTLFKLRRSYEPPESERAEVHYMIAFATRFKKVNWIDPQELRDQALYHINQASTLCPGRTSYEDERRCIEEWEV
jgi:hypothetical protein